MSDEGRKSGKTSDAGISSRKIPEIYFEVCWVPLAVVWITSVLGFLPEPGSPYLYLPLLASILFLGLPHGAVDYTVLPRSRGEKVGLRSLGIVGVLYLFLGGLYGVVWMIYPVFAALFFLALTWFHWGQGEIYPLAAGYDAGYLEDRYSRYATLVVKGGIPILVPLATYPDSYRRVVSSLVEPLGVNLSLFPSSEVRFGVLSCFAVFTAISLLLSRRFSDAGGWFLDAAETTGLWIYFLTVPPVLAVGVYFVFWHSYRHVVRAVELERKDTERKIGGVARFCLEATPTSVAALVFLAALTFLSNTESLRELTAVYLVSLAVLTLPHTVILTMVDRYSYRQLF